MSSEAETQLLALRKRLDAFIETLVERRRYYYCGDGHPETVAELDELIAMARAIRSSDVAKGGAK